MTDLQPDPSTETPPAGNPEQPPAGTQTETETTPPAGTANVEITPEIQKLIDDAAAQASRDANREAIAAKKRAKELEDAEQARKDAELSDAERLQNERDAATTAAEAAKAELRSARIESAILAAAGDFADPTDALTVASSIELDDDGMPVGVVEAVAALLAAKPHYAKPSGTPPLDASNPARLTESLSPQQQTEALRTRKRGPSVWG